MDRYLRASTRGIAVITFALGVVMVVLAVARGGGPLALGVVVGIAFIVLGALRFSSAPRDRT